MNINSRAGVDGAVLQTPLLLIINRPGVAGVSVTDSWFVKISLWRRHAPTVGNGAFSQKID